MPLFEPQVEGALLKQGSTDAVTFLSFWRVVAVVWHACGGDHGTTLTDELETFRDDILRLLEDPVQKGMVSSGQLRGLANNAAELSSTDQDTWCDFADNLPELGDLNATDIAVRHGGFVSVFGVALSLCKPGYMPTRRLVDCAMFSMLIFEK